MLPAPDEANSHRQLGSSLHHTLSVLTRVLAVGLLSIAGVRSARATVSITSPIPGTGAQGGSASTTQLPSQASRMQIRIASANASTDAGQTITLTLPSDTDTGTLSIVLNGNDVTSRFSGTTCSGAVCEEGTLSSVDGLRDGKNVLYAVAKRSDGTIASSRMRFMSGEMRSETGSRFAPAGSSGADAGSYPMASNFLPPSIPFSISPGGFVPGSTWISVGSNQSYPGACSTTYQVEILDRTSLAPVNPGVSNCFSSSAGLTAFLSTLNSSELVIVGTRAGVTADLSTQFDTGAIGGRVYGCLSTAPVPGCSGIYVGSPDLPASYLAIGVGGATSGSAYENYTTVSSPANESFGVFATGMLVEDANGHYNFESSGAVEYTVSPHDPNTTAGQSTVTLQGAGFLPRYAAYTYPNKIVFYSPSGVSGYWLLVLRRDNLDFVAGNQNNYQQCIASSATAQQQTNEVGCGTFYPTGSSDSPTATQAYQSLAVALNSAQPDELVFLVNVGLGAFSSDEDSFTVAATSYTDSNGNLQPAYYNQFAPALEGLGGTPITTLNLSVPGSTYTLVSCTACGNSLTGHAVVSSSVFAQQGQTGFVHGLLSRNIHGLFWPTETSQESASQNAGGSGANFIISKLNAEQPVEWPELNGTLLPKASSIGGQVAAYHYISYQLITQHYISPAAGAYLDDIHYYFTGSLNTSIDFHTFDPLDLPFPGQAGSCYEWTDPVTSGMLTCFTAQDFTAVSQQVKAEITYLDNVLLYMVSGSTNMKDIVASGNGSAALALIGAASTIEASSLQPPPSTPVTINTSNIINLVGSAVNIAATIASDGLIPPDASDELKDTISSSITIVGDLFSGASSITAGFTAGGGSAPLPSPDYTFQTTLGNLANSALQSQLTAGFDVTLDSILSDWGKLSQLGPQITDTSNPFYAPNQVAQNVEVALLGQASQRSFFIGLLPAYYSIQYFPNWFGKDPGPNYPDMGSTNDHENQCKTWYSWGPPTPPYVSDWYPTYAGTPTVFQLAYSPTPVDFYIIGGLAANPGQTNEHIPFIDSQLATELFGPTGLNIPFDPFVTRTGPMQSVFRDTRADGFDNWPANQTCSYNDWFSTSGVGAGSPSPNATATSLTAPPSAILGQATTLQAMVTSGSGIPSGSVAFQDGDVLLGKSTLDATGNATLSFTPLSLGTHSVTAYFIVNDPYFASQSAPSTIDVYASAPNMDLSLSTDSLGVSYGATSSSVTLQILSKSGLAGNLVFSCSGLPVGMSCNFSPAQATIATGGTASTSFTVSGSPVRTSGVLMPHKVGIILFCFSVVLLARMRNGRMRLQLVLSMLLLILVSSGCIVGCGGNGGSKQLQQSGSQTIMVTVKAGVTVSTTPLVLNIQ